MRAKGCISAPRHDQARTASNRPQPARVTRERPWLVLESWRKEVISETEAIVFPLLCPALEAPLRHDANLLLFRLPKFGDTGIHGGQLVVNLFDLGLLIGVAQVGIGFNAALVLEQFQLADG